VGRTVVVVEAVRVWVLAVVARSASLAGCFGGELETEQRRMNTSTGTERKAMGVPGWLG
jgi:hypothetical protein